MSKEPTAVQQFTWLKERMEDHLTAYKRQHRGFWNPPNRGYVKAIENSIDLIEDIIDHGGLANYKRNISL
jgi:hypothetical protein